MLCLAWMLTCWVCLYLPEMPHSLPTSPALSWFHWSLQQLPASSHGISPTLWWWESSTKLKIGSAYSLIWPSPPWYCREYGWVHFTQSLHKRGFESVGLGKVDSGCCIDGYVDVCNLCCGMTQWKIADWALITSHCEGIAFTERLIECPCTPCDLYNIINS